VLAAAKQNDGIATATLYAGNVRPAQPGEAAPAPVVKDGRVLIQATLKAQPDSSAAEQVVRDLRRDLPASGSGVLVGGVTAIALDTNDTAQSDLQGLAAAQQIFAAQQ